MKDYIIDKLIKVAGTNHDRRRKLTDSQIRNIQKEYSCGKSICELAKKYDVAPNTIHYHVDEEFKTFHNERRKYSVSSSYNKKTVASRIAHKKYLLSALI